MLQTPFFDPEKSYEDNWQEGPFGAFADGEVFREDKELSFSFLGFRLNGLLGIPAGPLLNGRFVKAALDKGFDVPMYKTLRTKEYKSHVWPNVLAVKVEGDLTPEKATKQIEAGKNFSEPLSITNSFGVPSKSPDFWQKDLEDCVRHAKKGQIVAASVQGTRWDGYSDKDYVNDWAMAGKLAKETGVPLLEANLSCPNEGTGNLMCFDTEKSRTIAEAIKEKIGDLPLLLKTAYFTDEKLLEEFVRELGSVAQGISVINTIPAEIVDKAGNQALPGEGRRRSGVCGQAIKWAGLDMVRRLKKLREENNMSFAIIGGGGVMNKTDFEDYLEVGADLVMSATSAMWNPFLAQEVKAR